MSLPTILDFAHSVAGRAVEEGGVAVDATVGNGHDTLFLAQSVGPAGEVIGFDVQDEALAEARRRLRAGEEPQASVQFVQAGHETMAQAVPEEAKGRVGAVMFNLGYLPGGDHSVTTAPETTRRALDVSTTILRPGGVITVVAYTGHEGGVEEARAVDAWVRALPQSSFRAISYRLANATNDPPRLFAVEKRTD
jgi:16S rRNA C1402 N4-methylase RsmH